MEADTYTALAPPLMKRWGCIFSPVPRVAPPIALNAVPFQLWCHKGAGPNICLAIAESVSECDAVWQEVLFQARWNHFSTG